MSYLPCDIPFMSDEELQENGIQIPKDPVESKENKTIRVAHPNGYTGLLYGKSSMRICDKTGREVLHTGARTANTEDELYQVLSNVPLFVEMFEHIADSERTGALPRD